MLFKYRLIKMSIANLKQLKNNARGIADKTEAEIKSQIINSYRTQRQRIK